MRPICENWTPRNEATTPLEGKPDTVNIGIIKTIDPQDRKYSTGLVYYERFGENEFQYVIEPYWDIIDALPVSFFHGIPGVDLDLRLKRYYRVNMTPVLISERTPSKNRVDLWELLESVGLEYYDRFEWLLRTHLRSGMDNLVVDRFVNTSRSVRIADTTVDFLETLNESDTIHVESLEELSSDVPRMSAALRTHAKIFALNEERFIEPDERCKLLESIVR